MAVSASASARPSPDCKAGRRRIQANVSVAFAGHQKSGTQYGTATLSSPPREKWLRWNVCTEDGSIVAMIGLQDVMWKRRRGEEEEKARG